MSLDKAIKFGKEKRKPYTGSKTIDYSCRNHGSCPYCKENRLHKFRDKHPRQEDDDDINEDQIVYWRDHLDVFIEECFGVRLTPAQKILLREKTARTINEDKHDAQ